MAMSAQVCQHFKYVPIGRVTLLQNLSTLCLPWHCLTVGPGDEAPLVGLLYAHMPVVMVVMLHVRLVVMLVSSVLYTQPGCVEPTMHRAMLVSAAAAATMTAVRMERSH
jgi:uncharacterized membrane protein